MIGKKYFIASAILCGLSLIVLIVDIAVTAAGAAGIGVFFILLAACIVLGFVANLLIRKVSNGGKIAGAVFVLSYLQYLAPFGILWLLKQIGIMLGSLFKTATEDTTKDTVYTVHDANGFERTLKFFDYGTDGAGQRFKKYRDDLGYFWRTYDDGNTFEREDTYC